MYIFNCNLILIWIYVITNLSCASQFEHLHHFEYVQPMRLSINESKSVSTRIKDSKHHVDEAQYFFTGYGKEFNLTLQKNRKLISDSFFVVSQKSNGEHIIKKDVEHCYYHGTMNGNADSHVTMNTCNGLNGIIMDDNGNEYLIESTSTEPSKENLHILYKSEHLKLEKNGSCGHNHTHGKPFQKQDSTIDDTSPLKRNKRSAIDAKKYVEIILVLDNREYHLYGMDGCIKRAIDIMNNVDSVYKTMNTRVALTGVVVWNIFDNIKVSLSAGETLTAFQKYTASVLRDTLNLNHDSAQLVSGINFNGSTVGLAGVGVICSRSSCAINQDQDRGKVPVVTSNTVAHELGHNLGLYHYSSDNCACKSGPCVMTPSVSYRQVKGFADCSQNNFENILSNGGMACVFGYPEKLFGDPMCGNGYVEKGEECDCGSEEECKSMNVLQCCNPATCKLHDSAQCSDGPCCESCKFKAQGELCREKFDKECDLQEYCTGYSQKCPNNIFIKDGMSCDNDQANCYQGACVSYDDQCQVLWGKNATKARDECFTQNDLGIKWANCGKNDRGDWIKCKPENRLCGKLQCSSKDKNSPIPTYPIIGRNKAHRKVFLTSTITIVCQQGITSLGAEFGDPTTALQGSKCGQGKMCVANECVNVSSLSYIKACPTKCLNGGICNSNGNCHCPEGFACPYCELAGPGGSFDSGQGCLMRGDCECISTVSKVILVLVFVVLPLCVAIGFLWFKRKRFGFNIRSKKDKSSSTRASIKKRPEIHIVDPNTDIHGTSMYSPEAPTPIESKPFLLGNSVPPKVSNLPQKPSIPATKPTYTPQKPTFPPTKSTNTPQKPSFQPTKSANTQLKPTVPPTKPSNPPPLPVNRPTNFERKPPVPVLRPIVPPKH